MLIHSSTGFVNPPQHSPFPFTAPSFFTHNQAPTPTDLSPRLPPHQKPLAQQVIGTLLYYARAVDPTILVTLSTITTKQASPTTQTFQRLHHLLRVIAMRAQYAREKNRYEEGARWQKNNDEEEKMASNRRGGGRYDLRRVGWRPSSPMRSYFLSSQAWRGSDLTSRIVRVWQLLE